MQEPILVNRVFKQPDLGQASNLSPGYREIPHPFPGIYADA